MQTMEVVILLTITTLSVEAVVVEGKISEPCRCFNRGKCSFGSNCKCEHHCSYCFKFGHGSVNCRKATADREKNNQRGDNHRRDPPPNYESAAVDKK